MSQSVSPPAVTSARALVTTMRPRQWTKNLLVLAAPLAAGALSHGAVALNTALAFGCFCAASSAVYLFNDVRDADADRQHPVKRLRPIAAGTLSPRLALAVAGLLAAVAVAASFAAARSDLALVVLAYLATSVWYCLQAKHIAVVELAVVASGFVLRAAAGGLAADLPISRWFLIVASFASLLVVAGKRYSEILGVPPSDSPESATIPSEATLAIAASRGRPVLAAYTPQYLRFVWTTSAAVCATAYCLWAFEVATDNETPWPALSVAPFVIAMLRYALDVDQGRAQEPERIVLSDRTLQGLAVVWVVTFAIGAVHA